MMFFGMFPFFGFLLLLFLLRGVGTLISRSRNEEQQSRLRESGVAHRLVDIDDEREQQRSMIGEAALYRLAHAKGGTLTVSDVVVSFGCTIHEAEEAMNAVVDGLRVTMEVLEDGRIVYEFPEIVRRLRIDTPRQGTDG